MPHTKLWKEGAENSIMENILMILNNDSLTEEEKVVLLKELVTELKEKQEGYDSSYDKYNDDQKPIVKKNRERAA